eukprot:TRINITY_DN1324_c0_g1_i1.p2 TRINITY_DN1324_c0_g1~~TRINITY_DN1324_c0_g1_i1.p2  ORF type:complete len:193 (-),score=53.18 TRINITY_DN1324_c0_g1_i1:615-1193(-)
MISIAPGESYKLFGHGPTVLVATYDSTKKSKVTLMTAAWNTPLEYGVLGVVIGDGSHTSNLLKAGREKKERTLFSINAPAAAIKDQIVTIGCTTGGKIDKLEDPSIKSKVFVVEGLELSNCIAHAECELIDAYPIPGEGSSSTLFVGKVIKAKVRADLWDAEGKSIHFKDHASLEKLSIHSAGDAFIVPNEI